MRETDFTALLLEEIDWAIAQKRSLPASDSNAFKMHVKIVGPGGQIAHTRIQWSSHEEKHLAMSAVAAVAEITSARAVIVVSDVRALNIEAFCSHFRIAQPVYGDSASLEAFFTERSRVMKPFDDDYGNLPAGLYEEFLMVFAYGPTVKRMFSVPYSVVEREFVFGPPTEQKTGLEINMVPRWWPETKNPFSSQSA